MKIGLLTFFESDNYGTVLQAFALQHYLETRGHGVELIRLRRAVHAASARFAKTAADYTMSEKIRIKASSFFHRHDDERKKAAFRHFRENFLHTGAKYYETDEELLQDPPQYDSI